MAAFDAMRAAGQAVLEDRAKPTLRIGRGAGKRWTMAMLIEEAKRNPRVHVALRVGHELVTVEKPAAAAPPQETRTMMQADTTSGVCRACGYIGVAIVNGHPAAHNDRSGKACAGKPAVAAPAVPPAVSGFAPRCGCDGAGTCRVCRGAAPAAPAVAIVKSAPAAVARQRRAPAAPRVTPPIAPRVAAPAAPAAPRVTPPIAPTANPAALLSDAATVARGIVEFLQARRDARRDAAHAAELLQLRQQLLRRDAMQAPAVAPAASSDCYLCNQPMRMGYVLDGKHVCRGCRGAHREAYYAAQGRQAPPRKALAAALRSPRGRSVAVGTLQINADFVEIFERDESERDAS